MHPVISEHLNEIHTLCKQHRVDKLWLIGSALDEHKFTPTSDIDFLLTYDDGGAYNPDYDYVAHWSNLLTALRNLPKREVQLIEYGELRNLYFRTSVEATKKLIYDKNTENLNFSFSISR
ncbi:MAG: nucleotidyltransferase domain-containing protein [Bacteroidota bacterium]